MITVKATSISDAFHQILYKFFEKDVHGNYVNAYVTEIDAGSFGKDKADDGKASTKRLQVDLVVAEISHPGVRPLAVTFPEAMSIPPVATQEDIETYFANYLMNAEVTVNEEYTYGSRMLEFPSTLYTPDEETYEGYVYPHVKLNKFNQIDWVINHFKEAPGNNHCCVEIAKGDDVLLKHAPCLRLLSFKIVNGKLNITIFFRSWDFWSGFPTNLGGLQLLNEYIASEIGVKPGKMFALSDGLHIYTHCIQFAAQRLGIEV
jgi:thymidylate synthase